MSQASFFYLKKEQTTLSGKTTISRQLLENKGEKTMVRYKAIIAYDGTNFNGFQKQPNGRTVQEEVEKHYKKWQTGKKSRSLVREGQMPEYMQSGKCYPF